MKGIISQTALLMEVVWGEKILVLVGTKKNNGVRSALLPERKLTNFMCYQFSLFLLLNPS